jgi:hypothetical protein
MLLACRPSEHRLGILLCSLPPWLFQVIAHGCMQPAPWPLLRYRLGGRGRWQWTYECVIEPMNQWSKEPMNQWKDSSTNH